MKLNGGSIVNGKDSDIKDISYIGSPESNTAMYVTKKVEHLLSALKDVTNCLIFVEEGIFVPAELLEKHSFCFSKKPQLEYSKFANVLWNKRFEKEKQLKYRLTPEGYFVSDDVIVPDSSYIEPGCVIGPDVIIAENASILAGTVIKHARIGRDFLANECAVIGANGFTMCEDEKGNKVRIPTLGKVIIGDGVEVGVNDNISCGSCGNTIIEEHVKLDALVHVGHDARICRNVEVTAGTIIGGFAVIGERAFVGIGSTLRNRIKIGEEAIVGMGSNVTKTVNPGTIVVGNPAKLFKDSGRE